MGTISEALKQLNEEHLSQNDDFHVESSAYQMKNICMNSGRKIKILYDLNADRYFWCYGDLDYIHNNMLRAAIEDGYMDGYSRKNRDQYIGDNHKTGVISYMIWWPKAAEDYKDPEINYDEMDSNEYDVVVENELGDLYLRIASDYTGVVYLPFDKNDFAKLFGQPKEI